MENPDSSCQELCSRILSIQAPGKKSLSLSSEDI
jgi:hypothetical protein